MNRLCLLFVGCLAVLGNNTCRADIILLEDFEGALDSRLSISSSGTFISMPGTKNFVGLAGSNAFGFGRSDNPANSFFNFVTTLTVTFENPTFVSEVSFIELEAFGNWGSQGEFYTSAELPAAMSLSDPRVLAGEWGNDFGRIPQNDFTPDSSFRFHTIEVDAIVTSLNFQVWDITSQSEVYIDNLAVHGTAVPEPSSLAIVSSGAVFFFTRRRRCNRAEV